MLSRNVRCCTYRREVWWRCVRRADEHCRANPMPHDVSSRRPSFPYEDSSKSFPARTTSLFPHSQQLGNCLSSTSCREQILATHDELHRNYPTPNSVRRNQRLVRDNHSGILTNVARPHDFSPTPQPIPRRYRSADLLPRPASPTNAFFPRPPPVRPSPSPWPLRLR